MRRWAASASLTILLAGRLWAGGMTLWTQPQVAEQGELVTMQIQVDAGVRDLRGYSLDLHFDPAMLSLFSLSEGELMLSHPPTFLYWEQEQTGDDAWIHVDHAILGGDACADGAGSLLVVSFLAEGCGIDRPWLGALIARDGENAELPLALLPAEEHQVCQVPRLSIENLPEGGQRLAWGRVLNRQEFQVWSRTRPGLPWAARAATLDTSWVDPAPPDPRSQYYRLTVRHH